MQMIDEDEHVVEENEDEDEKILSFRTNSKIYSFSYLEMFTNIVYHEDAWR